MSSRFILASVLFLAASCSTSAYSEAEGLESGPCYPNGTCNAGLVCASSRCVRLEADAGPDASVQADGGTGSDAASDAGQGDAASCAAPSGPPALKCDGPLCNSGQKCCPGGGGCKSATDTCPSVTIACVSPNDCVGSDRCCATGEVVLDSACPFVVQNITQAKCRGGPCTGGEVTLCYASGATVCETGRTCVAGRLDGNVGGNSVVGVCR